MRTRCNLIRPISPTTVASPNKSPQWLALSILANVNATRCKLLPICPLIVLAMFCPCGLCLIHFRSLFFLAIICPSLSLFLFFVFLFLLSIPETSLSASHLFSIPFSSSSSYFFFNFFLRIRKWEKCEKTQKVVTLSRPFSIPASYDSELFIYFYSIAIGAIKGNVSCCCCVVCRRLGWRE